MNILYSQLGMEFKAGKLLEQIEYPADLRKLKEEQLPELSKELRQFIIDVVSQKADTLVPA